MTTLANDLRFPFPIRKWRYRCDGCGWPYGSVHGYANLIVPNWAFEMITDGTGEGHLCPNCIIARLSAAGLENVPFRVVHWTLRRPGSVRPLGAGGYHHLFTPEEDTPPWERDDAQNVQGDAQARVANA